MKRYKVREVIELLEADGWFLYTTRSDHRQFKHPTKVRASVLWPFSCRTLRHDRGFALLMPLPLLPSEMHT